MRRSRTTTACVITLLLILLSAASEAGHRIKQQQQACRGGTCTAAPAGYVAGGFSYSVRGTYYAPMPAPQAATPQAATQAPPKAPSKAMPAPQAPSKAMPAAQYGDPYGFTAWLNGVRAQHGRGPVGFDPALASDAAVNNGQQHARGMGHHFMGRARRQNSGMGASSTVWQAWMASPAHQAALLDPSITAVGIAASGSYWTYAAY